MLAVLLSVIKTTYNKVSHLVLGAFMRLVNSLTLLLVSLLLSITASVSAAESQLALNGEQATTQATLTFNESGEIVTATAQATIKIVFPELNKTPATVQFYQFSEDETAQLFSVEAMKFAEEGGAENGFLDGNEQIDIPLLAQAAREVLFPNDISLVETDSFATGDPLFVLLTDLDQNRNPTKRETVVVEVQSQSSNDSETILLTEIFPDSGQFVGYLISAHNNENTVNGVLSVAPDTFLTATYIDRFDANDIATAKATIDPHGIVFNSETGLGINGVEVTIIDNLTNEPATVYSTDSITQFPSTITTGSVIVDAQGREFAMPDGGYFFPNVAEGEYRYQLTIPEGYYDRASVKTDEQLKQLANGNELSIVNGSRLDVFAVTLLPNAHIDIPLDPIPTQAFITKRANKGSASAGDFVQFTIDVANPSVLSPTETDLIIDTLPVGFRLITDSVYINDVAFTGTQISEDGRVLHIPLAKIDAESQISIKYVTQVTAATPLGRSTNVAELQSQQSEGLIAQAHITIVEDLFRSKSILMGRVIWDDCKVDAPQLTSTTAQESDDLQSNDQQSNDQQSNNQHSQEPQSQGVEGVRIYMEDGTFVNTDSDGQWHIEGVTPGTHVVQLDLESLPEHLEVVECHKSSRRAGTPFSEFVDVQGGTLWRTDFHLKQKQTAIGQIKLKQSISARAKRSVQLHVQFDHDSAEVKPQYVAEIETLATYLQQHPNSTATIAGHTSSLGNDKYNFRLSYLRADAIKQLLIEKYAIDASRLQSKGYGESLLLDLSDTAQAHSTNRRIEAIIHTVDHNLNAPQALQVKLKVQLDVASRRNQTPNDQLSYQLNYQPPSGWQILDNSIEINDQVAQFITATDVNQSVKTLLLTNDKHQLVKFNLVPISALDSAIDYRGHSVAYVSYPQQSNNAAQADISLPRMVSSQANEVSLASLLQAKIKVETTSSDSFKGAQKIKHVEHENQNTVVGLAQISQQRQATVSEESSKDVGILSLVDGQYLSRSTTQMRFKLDSRLKPVLLVDGKQVSEDRQAFKSVNSDTGLTLYNYIGVEIGDQGEHTVSLQGIGPFGNARFEQTITVQRTGEVQKIRLIEAEGNIADGKTPLKIQLGLLDNNGSHIPAQVKLDIKDTQLRPYESEYDRKNLEQQSNQITMFSDGSVLFDPVAQAGMYSAEIIYDENVSEKIKFYVKPHLREWILVGFAQGTLGYNNLSGNAESLDANDIEDDLYQDGEVKFYAKGKVKGDWLLTMAYDTTKREKDEVLNQTITPGAYYTLYGDASTQEHDASSRKKLYLRIEKDQYYALFGDFSTGLTEGELTNYSRSLTGVKAEYNGEQYNVNMFAAETTQAYVRDDIQGQGISGIYYLSNQDIVTNSETITLETRDRFDSGEIINSQQLTRFVDYSIDYVDGSIFFKRPILSRDRDNNPMYIVAEYETESDIASEDVVAGGRVGLVLPSLFNGSDAGEIGITHVNEGDTGRSGQLTGVDLKYNVTDDVRITAEVASTEAEFEGNENDGDAYLVEVEHQGEHLDGRVYVREQKAGFGLGQQSESEESTRKMGSEARYKFDENWDVEMEVSQQKDLTTSRKRDLIESRVEYDNHGDSYYLGGRTAKESGGNEKQSTEKSDQVILGARKSFLDNDLTVYTDFEKSISENDNEQYPTRVRVGADYDITSSITLTADQEYAMGDEGHEQSTLVGVTARPWTGMNIGTSLQQDQTENADRLFANYGLFQTVELSPSWDVNFGIDRAQLLRDDDTTEQAIPEGNDDFNDDFNESNVDTEDFTAVSMGANYNLDAWGWDSLVEYRTSDSDDKWNLMSSAVHDLEDGIVLAGKAEVFNTESNLNDDSSVQALISLGFAYRPIDSRWIILDKLEFKYDDDQTEQSSMRSRRYINNTNANYLWDNNTQIALQYSFKYVLETFEQDDYDGFTDLFGTEIRHNLNPYWDIGLHGSMMHSWEADIIDYSYGASVGYSPEKNVWVSLGYNVDGFDDDDFTASEYKAKGFFLRFRIKADQESFKSLFE